MNCARPIGPYRGYEREDRDHKHHDHKLAIKEHETARRPWSPSSENAKDCAPSKRTSSSVNEPVESKPVHITKPYKVSTRKPAEPWKPSFELYALQAQAKCYIAAKKMVEGSATHPPPWELRKSLERRMCAERCDGQSSGLECD